MFSIEYISSEMVEANPFQKKGSHLNIFVNVRSRKLAKKKAKEELKHKH